MSNTIMCCVCDSQLGFRWTDTHGIGVCDTCGTPYRILHYDSDNKPVEKGPECQLRSDWIAVAKKYYTETKRMVDPGGFDCGCFSGRDRTYSGASREDIEVWNSWLNAQKDELPKEVTQ